MKFYGASSSQRNTRIDNGRNFMSLKNSLTNEELRERFDNSFQLVNYAIGIAREKILKGEELDSNPSSKILEMILDNKELTVELEDEIEEEEVAV